MLTEKEMFKKIRCDFDRFCGDGEFYSPSTLEEIVDDSIKKYGLESNLILLATPIAYYRGSADFLKVNAYMNDFEEYSSIKTINEFFDENYFEEMKDEKFAKQAYNFAQCYLTQDEFKEFVNLRKPCKDAFCPENEHAPER